MADEATEEPTSADVVADAAQALGGENAAMEREGATGGADDEQEGRTDEPADDAAEGGDYNPEDFAEEVDDDGEPVAAKSTTDEPATELTPEQQAALDGKSQAEIADALLAASQTAEETAAETPTSDPASETPAQPATPQAQEGQLQEAVEALMSEDPNLRRQVGELGTLREGLETRAGTINKNLTEITSLDTEITRGTAVLEYLNELATADPDDPVAAEKARDHKIALTDLRTRRSELRSETVAAQAEQRVDRQQYGEGLREVRDAGQGFLNRGAQQAEDEATYNEHKADATNELNAALPKLMKEWGFSDDMKGFIEDEIGLWSQNASDADLRAGNLEHWIRSLTPKIVPKFEKHREHALKGYAKLKRTDAIQPAPEGRAAAAKDRPDPARPLSAKDADRTAARQMRSAFVRPR